MSEEYDNRQRMEQWVREVESRNKPRLRSHNMSKEEIEERNKSPHFNGRLEVGKSSEKYVAQKLLAMHFDTVQDISMEKFEGRGNGLYYSPFDLLVTNCCYRFLVDVKRRNYRVPIGIPVLKLIDYEAYDKYDTNNKLIVFHFPATVHEDCFFINIKDIKDMCYIVGPFYHIEIRQLTSLTAKGLINTLEPRARLSVDGV